MLQITGPSSARIAMVLDYPESTMIRDDSIKSTYVWNYLKGLLKDGELSHSEVYITCLIKERYLPQKRDRRSWYKRLNEDFGSTGYTSILAEELKCIKPNVVITVGDAALTILTGLTGTNKYQGSILPVEPNFGRLCGNTSIKVIPIIHPREMAKDIKILAYTPVFIQRAKKYQHTTGFVKPDIITEVCTNYRHFENFVSNYPVQSVRYLCSDIETYNGFITCFSLCFDGKYGISIPLLDRRTNALELSNILKHVDYIFRTYPLINQNIRYDQLYFERAGFELTNIVGDPMLLMQNVYPEFPKNLGFMTSLTTEIPYFKDEGKEFDPKLHSFERLYLYNAQDAIAAHQVHTKLLEDAKELNVDKFYENGTMKWYYMYARIEDRGIRIDEEQRERLKVKYQGILEDYGATIATIIGRELNPNSPKQVAELVYDELGLPEKWKYKPDGGRALRTDEKILEDLALNYCDDLETQNLMYKIMFYRKAYKICKFLRLNVHPDGMLRYRIKLTGTETGRTSNSYCDERIYKEDGPNKIKAEFLGWPIQTVPKHGYQLPSGETLGNDLLSIFTPSPGCVFIELDQSQAEARIVALLSRDFELLERFDKIISWAKWELKQRAKFLKDNPYRTLAKKNDVHVWTASMILNKPAHYIEREDRQGKGKKPRHAGNYGMGYNRLAEDAVIPRGEAKLALDRFHEITPKIRNNYHRTCDRVLKESGVFRNPLGRRRQFFGRPDEGATQRVAYCFIPQSTVSDQQKFAMYETEQEIGTHKMRWLAEKHDGSFGEVKKDLAPVAFETMKRNMEAPINFRLCSIPVDYDLVIPAECEWSETSWGEMKEWTGC